MGEPVTAQVRLVDADELRRRIVVLGSVAWLAPNEWRKR